MKTQTIALAAGTALAAIAATAPASAQIERVEVGTLDCVIEGGTGFIIGSTKDIRCTYDPANTDVQDSYFGVINKFGVDVGQTDATYLTWTVLAPTGQEYEGGALAGDYYGVSAEATVGAGVGANALIGGSEDTIVLQPISLQSQTGLNFALTVSELQLRSAAN